jgi:translation initiation factor 4A
MEASFSNWEEVALKRELLKGIYGNGFERPSPIQQKAILPIIQGKDVLAQAQSGTGKTGAFCVGAIQNMKSDEATPQLIILAPTRELAQQIQTVFDKLAIYTGLKSHLLIGGTQIDLDIFSINNKKPQAFIGCPGRVLDILRRRVFNAAHLKMIVLDEADEILSQGFQQQLYEIFQFMTEQVQVVMFSATMPDSVVSITKKIMQSPVEILVKAEQMTLEGISQFYVQFDNDAEKTLALKDLYEGMSVSQSIIYCNSVKRVADLYEKMCQANFPVCCIHREMDRDKRAQAYTDFVKGKYRMLISSNITARGIDVQQVGIVINYDVPNDISTYLHRIGRSGRWGRKGVGINFVNKSDMQKLKQIEEFYQTKISELPSNYSNYL